MESGELHVWYQCMVCGEKFESGAAVIEHLADVNRGLECPRRVIYRFIHKVGAVGMRDDVLCSPHSTVPSAAVFNPEVNLW